MTTIPVMTEMSGTVTQPGDVDGAVGESPDGFSVDTLITYGFILLIVLVVAFIMVVAAAIKGTRENVSVDAARGIAEMTFQGVYNLWRLEGDRARETPNPYDDALHAILNVPIEKLIEHLESLGLEVVNKGSLERAGTPPSNSSPPS